MSRSSLPDWLGFPGFGRIWRREVWARTSTARATALAWVLLDSAQRQRDLSWSVEAGDWLMLETRLYEPELERACDELIEAGLLAVHGDRWELVLP